MKKQQIIAPLVLAIILMIGIAGCKSSPTAQSPDRSTTESSSTTSEEKSAEQKQARSPAAQKRREQIRKQIKAVLQPAQVQQLESKMQTGEKMRQALNSVNLTAEQKTKIEAIYQTAHANRQAEYQGK
jgi:Spy/CpxP family protein refolding chaperone